MEQKICRCSFLRVLFSLINIFFCVGRAASRAFGALASGYPLHHPLCASRTGGGEPRPYGWFRFYPSRKRTACAPEVRVAVRVSARFARLLYLVCWYQILDTCYQRHEVPILDTRAAKRRYLIPEPRSGDTYVPEPRSGDTYVPEPRSGDTYAPFHTVI
jgi:hypothetical protein